MTDPSAQRTPTRPALPVHHAATPGPRPPRSFLMTTAPTLQSLIADRWVGRAAALRSRARSTARRSSHARRGDRLRRGAAPCAHGRPARPAGAGLPAARRAPEGAGQVPERAQGSSSTRSRRHTGATRSDGWIDIEGGTRHAVRLRRHRRQRAALGQRGARRAGDAAGQEGRLRRHATSWCRAAASRCTSTPSTSRSGACSRSSRPASWPACPASASRPPPPAT